MLIRTLVIIIVILAPQVSLANETTTNEPASSAQNHVSPEYIFSPSETLATQVSNTLARAKSEQKLALFVLGAQWCHDSKALAKSFSSQQMQQILSDNYQVLFVDVGYLEKGFELVQQFKQPIYYGTPTVMVINPETNQLLNKHSMKKWLNAYKVPLGEYISYFNTLTKNRELPAVKSKTMQAYLEQINNFEQQQAIRLRKAYQVVGPLLKAYIEGDAKQASQTFVDKWQPVQNFRYRIQNDINKLIEQAKDNVKTNSNKALTFPSYPAFSWENKH